MRFRTFVIAIFCIAVSACSQEVPGGEVTIKNDSQDSEYNVVEFRANGGGGSFGARLKPGETSVIPLKNIYAIHFSRRYKEFTRVYDVECPSKSNKRITIKLIDVHLNRIAGGCKTVKAYKQ